MLAKLQRLPLVRASLESEERKIDEEQCAARFALLDQRGGLEAAVTTAGKELAKLQQELSDLNSKRARLLAKIEAKSISSQQPAAALSENMKQLHALGEEHVAYGLNRLCGARVRMDGEIRFLEGAMIPPKSPAFCAKKDPETPAKVAALRLKIAAAVRAEKVVASLAFSRKSPAEIRAEITMLLREAGLNLEFVKVFPQDVGIVQWKRVSWLERSSDGIAAQ